MNKTKNRKYETIRSRLANLKGSKEYENILKITRSQSRIDNPSTTTIDFTKNAETVFAVKIRDSVIDILKKRMWRSSDADREMERFIKSLQKWIKIILPACDISSEDWGKKFRDQFYLDQACKD